MADRSIFWQGHDKPHKVSIANKVFSFEDGRQSWRRSVSISILRNVREVVGPSICSSAMGMPTTLQISRVVWRTCEQLLELGLPRSRK